jgi:DNA replicative helicase MCM subunit Mcm2 (Cdc46/Mcm family)
MTDNLTSATLTLAKLLSTHPVVQLEELEVLDLQTLVSYISYARKYIQPQLSDEAAEELTRGYVEMRKRGNSPGSRKKVQ